VNASQPAPPTPSASHPGAVADNYAISQLDGITPQRCPCGWTRRAFATLQGAPASVHLVEIAEDSRVHYHRAMTEIYVVIEGEGWIELDGQRFLLAPMTAVMIKPGCRHRAVGRLKLLNIPIPAFDPADEWFD
jgi:quercetin dioxygenase-like cupin family protein